MIAEKCAGYPQGYISCYSLRPPLPPVGKKKAAENSLGKNKIILAAKPNPLKKWLWAHPVHLHLKSSVCQKVSVFGLWTDHHCFLPSRMGCHISTQSIFVMWRDGKPMTLQMLLDYNSPQPEPAWPIVRDDAQHHLESHRSPPLVLRICVCPQIYCKYINGNHRLVACIYERLSYECSSNILHGAANLQCRQ